MIKAREHIEKNDRGEYEYYFTWLSNYRSYNRKYVYEKDLKKACLDVAYEKFLASKGLTRNSDKGRSVLNDYRERIEKLAKRLEREFLRGEKKEKEKENKPLNGNNFTTIVMIDYSNEQLKKAAAENLESLVNGLFEDYTWLRGDITLSHFEAIRKSFSDQFSGFGEETFLEHFNQGEGDYFFKTTFHCTEEWETWYEFELIDFKPLEVI